MLMWWRSAVSFPSSFALLLAVYAPAPVTRFPELCVRSVLCCRAFPLASALGSTGSAADRSTLFVGFPATGPESDSPRPGHHRLRLLAFPMRTSRQRAGSRTRGLRFPLPAEHACMPGSSTTPGRPSACAGAHGHIAFHYTDGVGTWNQFSIAAQWLACTFPCRRFARASSRMPAHGSGPMWFAIPSSQWTCTTYSLPVSRRTCVKIRTICPVGSEAG